jgi:hypothetical protein
MNETHYERAAYLAGMIYSAAPNVRLGVMKDILDRVPHDAGLRRILTDPNLHNELHRVNGRLNIAKAASAYTKRFYGVSITTYIKQVKAGAVNEYFEPLRGPAQVHVEETPQVLVQRDPATFFAELKARRLVVPLKLPKRGQDMHPKDVATYYPTPQKIPPDKRSGCEVYPTVDPKQTPYLLDLLPAVSVTATHTVTSHSLR